MLVSNSCVNDTRVIRSANALSEFGFDTIVLAVAEGGETSEERRNSVLYKRLARHRIQTQRIQTQRIQTQSQVPQDAVSAISTYVLVPTYLADQAHLLSLHLSRFDPRSVRGLRKIEQQLRGPAASYNESPIQVHNIGLFQIMLEIGRRLIRLARGQGRRFIASGRRFIASGKGLIRRQLHFLLFRPIVDARRIRRLFEDELMKLRPDVIHAHDLVTLPAAAAAAKSLGAKLIYDSHELEVHRNTQTGVIEKWLRYHTERRHIKKCDAVVTVCDSIADHLAREYSIKRPVVVMNAPDVDQVLPSDADLRSHLGLARETPLAVYVGRITVGRGIEQIVDALRYLPEFCVALVGPTHKPTVEAALEIATKFGVDKRLHVLDPVPPGLIIPFISSADVSVLAIQNVCLSYYYCLPNKLLESAVAQLPMVVSNFPELRRFIEISGSGLVMDEKDPRDIARAIQEVYDNRHHFRLDAERLRRVEDIYGWSAQKFALREMYSRITPMNH